MGSATATPAASDGPRFVSITVNATVWPGVTEAGPVFVRDKSAEPAATGVEVVAVLFAPTGSVVVALAVTALTIGLAPA